MIVNHQNIQKYFSDNIIKIIKLPCGITNIIYKIITSNNTYILRIYGNKTDQIINRNNEKLIMNYLSKFNLAPKIINDFPNLRIEEFFNGKNNICPSKYQYSLCKTLVKIHNLPFNSNFPNFWNNFNHFKINAFNPYSDQINIIINNIKSFKNEYWNQEVLGHGDLTIGNILYENENQNENIKLIDFEYSCILPRAFELANHLCEYYGLDYNHLNYPSKDIRINLIKNYIINDKINNIQFNDNFLYIIDQYSLVSHYFWGCWSIIQSKISNIDFNYNEYAVHRFNLFNHYKNIL